MLMLLYSALLTAGLAISSPWWLVRMATTERYREGLRERLGRVPERLHAYVAGVGAGRVIWIHAVSVGEVLAASRLVAELGEALGSDFRVVISTTTRTGQTLARERFGAERLFYFPLDFAWTVRRYLRVLRPAALVLMESEIWPRILHECAREKIPVAVVNARVSDRSFKRGIKLRVLWGRALKMVSLWLAQSEEDARRLVALGANNVRVGGNLKYDVRAPKQSRIAELIKEAAAARPTVVAGSTVASTQRGVDCEEAQVIQGWMKGGLPLDAVLVLAPRHPQRFEEVWDIAFNFPSLKATELIAGKRRENAIARTYPDGHSLETMDIVVLDTIGDLAAVYGIADIAYVGGSMMDSGGHNPLEPAQFGVPVVMGESYENFREIVEKMISADAIRIVKNESELEIALEVLLKDRAQAQAMGERGRKVFEAQQGATKRAVDAIVAMVKP